VPAFISGTPVQALKGLSYDDLTTMMDLTATILAYAGTYIYAHMNILKHYPFLPLTLLFLHIKVSRRIHFQAVQIQ
jgi:hypothetical protein